MNSIEKSNWGLILVHFFSEEILEGVKDLEFEREEHTLERRELRLAQKRIEENWKSVRRVSKELKGIADSIFPFVKHRAWIRATTSGSLPSLRLLQGRADCIPLQHFDDAFHALGNGFGLKTKRSRQAEVELLMLLLEVGKGNPGAYNNSLFRLAVKYDRIEVVKILLKDPRIDPTAFHSESLISSVRNENLEIFKMLINDGRVEVNTESNLALKIAVLGNSEIFNLLLEHPSVDPSADDNRPLQEAAWKGKIDNIKVLLAHPKINLGRCHYNLVASVASGCSLKVLKLLLKDHRIEQYLSREDDFMLTNVALSERWKNLLYLLKDERVNPNLIDQDVWNRYGGIVKKISSRRFILIPPPSK
eukprot:TRINITY_DN11518_c0_g1_i1.p1 TRINITY_DN11518_c0_g1~~TRINITY_DN11518_c0_g1_i1.p1  ORF type:complete len:362 (-),score=95.07 TRINITY_DN11518_c0_g1_i1:168-1253(-)